MYSQRVMQQGYRGSRDTQKTEASGHRAGGTQRDMKATTHIHTRCAHILCVLCR